MAGKVSVIISFYNKLEYLIPVLSGFLYQTYRDFEILIADDGSTAEKVLELEGLLSKLPFAARHIWQPDNGFRKNRILNKAITQARGQYLIFCDGDCIPHESFVAEHFRYADEGAVLTGRRVNLSPAITARLLGKFLRPEWRRRGMLPIVFDGVFGKSVDVEKGFYIKNQLGRKIVNRKKRGLLGCNFSAYKEDLLDVNGFDERYELPSIGEDSDIQYRFELVDKVIISLNNIAVQYHLYHKPQERPHTNLELFEQVKNSRQAFTPYGIYRGDNGRMF